MVTQRWASSASNVQRNGEASGWMYFRRSSAGADSVVFGLGRNVVGVSDPPSSFAAVVSAMTWSTKACNCRRPLSAVLEL